MRSLFPSPLLPPTPLSLKQPQWIRRPVLTRYLVLGARWLWPRADVLRPRSVFPPSQPVREDVLVSPAALPCRPPASRVSNDRSLLDQRHPRRRRGRTRGERTARGQTVRPSTQDRGVWIGSGRERQKEETRGWLLPTVEGREPWFHSGRRKIRVMVQLVWGKAQHSASGWTGSREAKRAPRVAPLSPVTWTFIQAGSERPRCPLGQLTGCPALRLTPDTRPHRAQPPVGARAEIPGPCLQTRRDPPRSSAWKAPVSNLSKVWNTSLSKVPDFVLPWPDPVSWGRKEGGTGPAHRPRRPHPF